MENYESTYRIRKLYRPVVGWLWWLQRGWWMESNGPMGVLGEGRRTFRVEWEESYPTEEQAEARLREIQHGRIQEAPRL